MPLKEIETGVLPQRLKKEGPVGFAAIDEETESREIEQVAVIKGRRRKIETTEGGKKVTGQTRLVRTPVGLRAIAGGDGASISVDDLTGLLNTKQTLEVAMALHKDRKRRKNNL